MERAMGIEPTSEAWEALALLGRDKRRSASFPLVVTRADFNSGISEYLFGYVLICRLEKSPKLLHTNYNQASSTYWSDALF